MPDASSSRADRDSFAHSHRSTPETPPRSTVFQPDPSQRGQTASGMSLYYFILPALLNGCENCSRADGVAGMHRNRGDAPGAVRLHLVLHLHGFHYDDALTRLDGLAGLDQQAHDLARHGCDDLFPIM